MEQKGLPPWVQNLAVEDLNFIRNFLLASGSLKALAEEYGVSYPTIRTRLDHLIERVRAAQVEPVDPFHARLKDLVGDGVMEPRLARELLDLHRKQLATEARRQEP